MKIMFDSDVLDQFLLEPLLIPLVSKWKDAQQADFFQTSIQLRENFRIAAKPEKFGKVLTLNSLRELFGIEVVPASGLILDFLALDETSLLDNDQVTDLGLFSGASLPSKVVADAVISLTSKSMDMFLVTNDADHVKFATRVEVKVLHFRDFVSLVTRNESM